MTDFYLKCGVTGMTILGIMGEAPKLEPEESLTVVNRRRQARPARCRWWSASPAPGFAAMRSLAKASMDAGAAGVMIAPIPSLRTDDQITAYFAQAVEAIGDDIPLGTAGLSVDRSRS